MGAQKPQPMVRMPILIPCVADVLIAAVYEEWQKKHARLDDDEPKIQAKKTTRKGWAGKALSALVAT